MQIGPFRVTWRHAVVVGGLGPAPAVAFLWVLAIFTPITSTGLAYTIGASLVALGALGFVWRPRAATLLLTIGFATMTATAAVRLSIGGRGTTVRLITLPDQGATRWIDRLIDERDLALFGQHAAFLGGAGLNSDEHDGLADALSAAYARMHAEDATTSSPTASTGLFLQLPGAFDAVVVEPRPSAEPPEAAVVYLHGFGGNFVVQAWLIAEAAREIGALTVAPSVDVFGTWWSPRGRETIRDAIRYCRGRGVRRLYLAGLSNGAVGVCRQAEAFAPDVAGLILISGADDRAPDAGLPVLALHGRYDDRMPSSSAAAFVRQAGDRGTFREFDGDHLLLAKHAAAVQRALTDWLRDREAQAAAWR